MPVIIMHTSERLGEHALAPRSDYWTELGTRLASIYDELPILTERGWRESRDIAGELALFHILSELLQRPTGADNLIGSERPT